jgi:hypothetical protein
VFEVAQHATLIEPTFIDVRAFVDKCYVGTGACQTLCEARYPSCVHETLVEHVLRIAAGQKLVQ